MKTLQVITLAVFALLMSGQALSQQPQAQSAEAREAEVDMRLREAEEKMAEAARTIAELTRERLPNMLEIEKRMMSMHGRPMLGVTIGDESKKGPVEGVTVMGVSPGSAADDAGIRGGDIITSVNGDSMSAASEDEAMMKLMDFMTGVEEGDKLSLEYIRNGNVGRVEIEPRVVEDDRYFWAGRNFEFPEFMGDGQNMVKIFKDGHLFSWGGKSWSDMELAELSEGLGEYFGTDKGLLVVRAPESNALQLEDGDVIQSIDGREPKSIGHAMRIFSSYQPGEKLEMLIMRDRKRRKIDVQIPDEQQDDRTGMLFDFGSPMQKAPARAPAPILPPNPEERA